MSKYRSIYFLFKFNVSNMTPLNPTQIMQYAASFQEQLVIQVEKEGDFGVAIVALRALSENVLKSQGLDQYPLLAGKIEALQGTYSELEELLLPEDLKKVQDLFVLKVKEKVQELESLTPEERTIYVENQRNVREEKARQQYGLRSKKRSAPSVLSDEEYRRELNAKSAAKDLFLSLCNDVTEDDPDDGQIIQTLRECCGYLRYYLVDDLDYILPIALRYSLNDLVGKIVKQRVYFDSTKVGVGALVSILVQFPACLFEDKALLSFLALHDADINDFLKLLNETKEPSDFIEQCLSKDLPQEILNLLNAYISFSETD